MTYSTNTVAANGTTNVFAVPFPYLNKSDVYVYVNGTLTTYSWVTAGTIQLPQSPSDLTGASVFIQRVTQQTTPDVVFQSGGLDPANLNTAVLQLLYIDQENTDGIAGAQAAALAAEAAQIVCASSQAASTTNANSVASVLSGLTSALMTFDYLSVALNATIPAWATSFVVRNFSTLGDGGESKWVKLGSAPGSPTAWQKQSHDGAWWQIQVPYVYPQMLGVVGAVNDRATILTADTCAAALGVSLRLNKRSAIATAYSFTAHVIFENGGRLAPAASATVDFLNGFEAPLHYQIFDFSAAGSGLLHTASARILTRELYPQMFGGVGDGATSNNAAFNSWALAVQASGLDGILPGGSYKFTTGFSIDLNPVALTGMTIRGLGGKQKCIMDFVGATGLGAGPAFLISQVTSTPKGNDYLTLEGFSVQSSHDGPTHQLGQSDFMDQINMPDYRMMDFQNFNNTANAQALDLNYILGGSFDIQCNCAADPNLVGIPMNGFALRCNQVQFSKFFGSIGTAGIGIHLTSGSNAGNFFDAVDNENSGICVQVDSAASWNNTWTAGTWNYYRYGYYDAAGKGNRIIVPQLNPSGPSSTPPGVGTYGTFLLGNGTGVTISFGQPGMNPVTAPVGSPAYGTTYTNTTGQQVDIYMWWSSGASTVTSFYYVPNGGGAINPGVTNGAQSLRVPLNPGDTLQILGSGTPVNWAWTNR